jgi:hypothetical protein
MEDISKNAKEQHPVSKTEAALSRVSVKKYRKDSKEDLTEESNTS